MQDAHAGVAVGQLGDDDAKAINVGHLRKRQVFAVHLAVDRIQRLFTAQDAHPHALAREGGLHLPLDPGNEVVASGARLVQGLGQHLVAPGVEKAEGQVLQFAVGEIQPQAVRDGGVDLQGFAADALPLAARHVAHGAHVVGAVGQLDQDDSHILGHGQQHFAERLGLVLFPGVELQPFQLGEPVHEVGHRRTEALDQFFLGDAAVFDGVVHERRHQGLGIEFPFGTLGRHRDRVGDVGVAVLAQLTQVGLVGKAVGLAHAFDLGRAQIVQLAHQCREAGRGGTRRRVRLGSGGSLFAGFSHGGHPRTLA